MWSDDGTDGTFVNRMLKTTPSGHALTCVATFAHPGPMPSEADWFAFLWPQNGLPGAKTTQADIRRHSRASVALATEPAGNVARFTFVLPDAGRYTVVLGYVGADAGSAGVFGDFGQVDVP